MEAEPARGRLSRHLRTHATIYLSLSLAVLAAGLASLALPYRQVCTVFVTMLMVCLWLAAVPDMAVVSLLPLALLPPLGVVGSKAVASQYFSDTVFLLFGSYLLSVALQEAQGHTRLALALLSRLPGEPMAVLAGFMSISAFLSMFMSNTATASVMCPLAASISGELRAVQQQHPCERAQDEGEEDEEAASQLPERFLEPYLRRIMLGIAYSCSIGGCATITGTGTNVAFSQVYDRLEHASISWMSWLLVGLPIALVMLFICWFWLAFSSGGLGLPSGYRIPMSQLHKRHSDLARISRAEGVAFAALLVTVLGWMFRAPKVFPGWADLLPDATMVSDGTLVMAVGTALFFIPARASDSPEYAEKGSTLLEWTRVQPQLPWGLLLLIGAGSTISLAFQESGLSASLSAALASLAGCPNIVLVLVSCVVAAGMSQVVSDVATALVLLPIVHGFATGLHENPLIMMVPVTFSCSVAFTLPISTPPNAIAFQMGSLRQAEMVRLGLPLVLVGIAVILALNFCLGFRVLRV